ncbi:MAG: monovalent cation/H+ antiporter subunit D, partial [Candidatus Competibacteraceae bacterium]
MAVSHSVILPVLLPFAAGVSLLLTGPQSTRTPAPGKLCGQRRLSLTATVLMLPLAAMLLVTTANDNRLVYALGNWPAPFGIVLVLDRLSALMLLATSLVALPTLWHAIVSDTDQQGQFFHPLFQFQLLGLNGAFLTGDLFNLFVFFEILLIASYGLLLHGGGPA